MNGAITMAIVNPNNTSEQSSALPTSIAPPPSSTVVKQKKFWSTKIKSKPRPLIMPVSNTAARCGRLNVLCSLGNARDSSG